MTWEEWAWFFVGGWGVLDLGGYLILPVHPHQPFTIISRSLLCVLRSHTPLGFLFPRKEPF